MEKEICEKINKMIDYVIKKERESGKTLTEINLKYTHGYCLSLATLIKSQLENEVNVRLCEFGRTYRKILADGRYAWKGHVWHTCIAVGELDELGLKPQNDAIIFDINGGREFTKMSEYLSNLYANPFDSNYIEDMATIIGFHKSEIFIEEEGILEKCYYQFLNNKKIESGDSGEMQ